MIRYRLLKDRQIDGLNITSIIYNDDDKLYLCDDARNEYLQYSLNDQRNQFKLTRMTYGYLYNYKVYGGQSGQIVSSREDLDDTIDYSYSPAHHLHLVGEGFFPISALRSGIELTMPEGEWTTDIRKESRLFQFLLNWISRVNLDDISKINSFEYTKEIEDNLARVGLRLKYHFRLLSWNGQLESEETGVITNEELTEVWLDLLSQMK